jgi:hypothetical protein
MAIFYTPEDSHTFPLCNVAINYILVLYSEDTPFMRVHYIQLTIETLGLVTNSKNSNLSKHFSSHNLLTILLPNAI